MATYIMLANYTAQGIANIKDSPARIDDAREQLAPMGVTIKDVYMTLGEYDLLVVVEAPDTAAVSKALIATGMQGNVSTTTLAALNEDEYREVLASLP